MFIRALLKYGFYKVGGIKTMRLQCQIPMSSHNRKLQTEPRSRAADEPETRVCMVCCVCVSVVCVLCVYLCVRACVWAGVCVCAPVRVCILTCCSGGQARL